MDGVERDDILSWLDMEDRRRAIVMNAKRVIEIEEATE